MAKLFLSDVGAIHKRIIEITYFPQDGELQFESFEGTYIHINFTREKAHELHEFLGECMGRNWTTDFPTIEGHYWVNTKYQENFTEKTKVVMCYLNSEGVFQYAPDDYEFFPDEKNFTHFLGPLPAPEPPLK